MVFGLIAFILSAPTSADVAGIIPLADLNGGAARELSHFVIIDRDASYAHLKLRGWTVVVSRRLLMNDRPTADRALLLLDRKLADIEQALNARPLRQLKLVPIWIEATGCAGQQGLSYHWSSRWLRLHGCNPDKARSVEIHSVYDFLAWEPTQPWLVLHELAHAYHQRVMGKNNASLVSAFVRAKRSGSYEHVSYRAQSSGRAYAMMNSSEYFAELTEAYFGVNDYFPFNRSELRRYDPNGFALVRTAWCDSGNVRSRAHRGRKSDSAKRKALADVSAVPCKR
ncbi:hypothetical protein GCM10022276_12420 [Sphingomonas limnosediminicola]|uniref:Metallopeptidase n=1 Tax=Sphingomonas limnosediminicola TaxID=940133 RepID=A0ABP7L665_9SPHN